MDIQSAKQRFGIIGNDIKLNRAIDKAIKVAPTDISVLVTGESGVGKEAIPKIIHSLSNRKHGKYIAVNCGAIPEGTIDSELFGHEKGAFTGATSSRNGYFEEADGGTIFLDEVGELPMTTQVRLLRVLENGEFMKVGSSVVQKTNVRIVAATNVDMQEAIRKERFREDLYYRLSTVEIHLPPLRERKDDIHLLFRKFASDFSEKYNMPAIKLTEGGVKALEKCRWSGNIRQLRNVAEQISVLEQNREISQEVLNTYLPQSDTAQMLPMNIENIRSETNFSTERDILYKVLFDMKSDLTDLKKLTYQLIEGGNNQDVRKENQALIKKIYGDQTPDVFAPKVNNEIVILPKQMHSDNDSFKDKIQEEPNLSFQDDVYECKDEMGEQESSDMKTNEKEFILKILNKHGGKRKEVAAELGIAERTLYRKLKQYNIQRNTK